MIQLLQANQSSPKSKSKAKSSRKRPNPSSSSHSFTNSSLSSASTASVCSSGSTIQTSSTLDSNDDIQALLIGTKSSGKKTILNHINNRLKTPINILCLSNEIPTSTYHNFIYDTSFIIFVLDSTQLLAPNYLQNVIDILGKLLITHKDNGQSIKKLLIFLNKQDLNPLRSTMSLDSVLNLGQFGVSYLIIPASIDATDNSNHYGISEGINWLLT